MANLGPQHINQSFGDLLQLPNGLTPAIQNVQDGSGNVTPLEISTTAVDLPIVGPDGSGMLSDLGGASGSNFIGFEQSGTGAVLRTSQDKMQEWVSVKDFGAVGDGITDDAEAILATISAAQPGSVIFFPSGTYLVDPLTSEGIVVNTKSSLRFFAANACIKRKTSVTTYNRAIFTLNGCNDIIFDGLTFDINGNLYYGGALKFYGGTRIRITQCNFIDSAPGAITSDRFFVLAADDITYGSCGDVYITNNYFDGGQLDLICRHVMISNNTFANSVNRAIGAGTNGSNRTLGYYVIEGNTFRNSNDSHIGIAVDPTSDSNCLIENIVISGNTFITTTAAASAAITLTTAGSNNRMRNIVIANNVMHDYVGQKLLNVNCGGVRGSGFVVTGNAYFAESATSTYPVDLYYIEKSIVANNAIQGSVSDGIRIQQMIGCSITGNIIEASGSAIYFNSNVSGRNLVANNKASSSSTFEVQVVDSQTQDQINVASDQIPTVTVTSNVLSIRGADRLVYVTGNASYNVDFVAAGYMGQILTFMPLDANFNLIESATLKLNGNFTSSTDDAITLVFDGNIWREISRSVN